MKNGVMEYWSNGVMEYEIGMYGIMGFKQTISSFSPILHYSNTPIPRYFL